MLNLIITIVFVAHVSAYSELTVAEVKQLEVSIGMLAATLLTTNVEDLLLQLRGLPRMRRVPRLQPAVAAVQRAAQRVQGGQDTARILTLTCCHPVLGHLRPVHHPGGRGVGGRLRDARQPGRGHLLPAHQVLHQAGRGRRGGDTLQQGALRGGWARVAQPGDILIYLERGVGGE